MAEMEEPKDGEPEVSGSEEAGTETAGAEAAEAAAKEAAEEAEMEAEMAAMAEAVNAAQAASAAAAATAARESAAASAAPAIATAAPAAAAESDGGIELLYDIELDATLQFGSKEMLLRDVLDLGPGDVVELDRHIAESVDLVVGDRIVARGEVVVANGNFALRILEVATPQMRLESIRCLF